MCSADFSRIIELSRLFKLQRERCVHLRIAVGFIWVIQRPTYSCSSYINCILRKTDYNMKQETREKGSNMNFLLKNPYIGCMYNKVPKCISSSFPHGMGGIVCTTPSAMFSETSRGRSCSGRAVSLGHRGKRWRDGCSTPLPVRA